MSLLSGTVWGSNFDGNSNDVLSAFNGSDTNITYSSANGIIIQGAGFNSASPSSIAVTPTPVNFALNVARSYSFWVKANGVTNNWIALCQDNSNAHSLWDIFFNASGLMSFQINPLNAGVSNALQCHTATTANNNAFHHVVISYDGSLNISGVKFYIDNVLTTTVNDANTLLLSAVTPTIFHLGDRGAFGGAYTGAVDAFYVFNYVVSVADVAQLWNGGAGVQYPYIAANGNFFMLMN